MLIRSLATVATLILLINSANSACDRDRNVQFQNPLYLNFDGGFFYM